MLQKTISTNMDRRDFMKILIALGAIAIMPTKFNSFDQKEKKLHFVGLGGAGTNTVDHFYRMGIKGNYTCITNPERPNLPSEIKFIKFIPSGQSHYENGTEVFNISDMHHKIEIPNSVMNIFKSNDKFVLLSGLGGYTGSYLIVELSRLLQDSGKNFMTICSLPFTFEGQKRKSYAEYAMKQLETQRNFKYFELDGILEKYGTDITLLEAFKKADEQFYNIFAKFSRF